MSLFDRRAIAKCYDRLSKAKESLYKCRNSKTLGEFISGWSDFLIYTGGIIHQVEAGSKHSPQARQWYGKIKRESKADPMLTYLFQSRNSEEHETEPLLAQRPPIPFGYRDTVTGEITFEDGIDWGSGVQESEKSIIYKLDKNFKAPNPRTFVFGALPTTPRLRPVTDQRFNAVFSVPTSFQGKPISNPTPLVIGYLYIGYLEGLIDDASSMI